MKGSFKLKKTSWHMRMMTFIWGFKAQDFSHMCPYFWLSVLNAIVFIPFAIIKIPILGVIWCFKQLESYLLKSEEAAYRLLIAQAQANPNKFIETFSRKCRKQYLKFYNRLTDRDWESRGDYIIFWENLNNAREAYLDELDKKEWDVKAEKKQNKAKIKLTNKQRISKIMKVIEPILRVLIHITSFIAVIVLLIYAYKGVLWMLAQNFKPRWDVIYFVLCILGSAIAAIILVILGQMIAKRICFSDPTKAKIDKITDWLGETIIKIVKAILWLPMAIFKGGKLTWQFVYSTYKDECPPIDWE